MGSKRAWFRRCQQLRPQYLPLKKVTAIVTLLTAIYASTSIHPMFVTHNIQEWVAFLHRAGWRSAQSYLYAKRTVIEDGAYHCSL